MKTFQRMKKKLNSKYIGYITFANNTKYKLIDENKKYYKIKVRKGYCNSIQIIPKTVNNIKFITYENF